MSSASCAVSVIIPAFNSATTLPRAVRSVLQQDLRRLEILIVDDGSTDGTAEAGRVLATDPRVRVIQLARNQGKPHAMNTGISHAAGRWLAVLDADDWYAPDRLSTLLEVAERNDVHLVADNQFVYDDGADQVVRTAFPASDEECWLDTATFAAGCNPYADFDYGMLKPMVRTSFARDIGLAYRENARLSEDFLYLLEFFALGGEGVLISRPFYFWRQAFGSISRQWTETAGGRWRYDFLSGVHASAEVLTRMQETGEPILARLLKRRIRAFRRLHQLQELNRLHADGAPPVRLAASILRHPSLWPLVIQRSMRRVTQGRKQSSPSRA